MQTKYQAGIQRTIWKFVTLVSVGLVSCAIAQTQPAPSPLPYTQNFGTSPFSTPPAGMATWGGSGSAITDSTKAANSVPTTDATLEAASGLESSGRSYGLASDGNARFYIQTSSSTTLGACQLALALDTTGGSAIYLSYDIEIIDAQTRTIGLLCQYRIGNTGSWTDLDTLTGANPFSQSGGGTGVRENVQIILPSAASDQPLVQIRWATWRGKEAGNSSGIAIDNISVTGSSIDYTFTVSVEPGTIPELGGSTTVTVSTSAPVTAALPVTLSIDDPSEVMIDSQNPAIIPTGATTASFTLRAIDDSHHDGPQSVSIQASAAGALTASASLTVTDDDDEWSPPENYYLAADGLSGLPLKETLKTIITNGHQQLSYQEVLNPLRAIHEDPAAPQNLITIYSDTSIGKYKSYYSGVADGPDATWSREHLWPVSYGLDHFNVNPGYEGADAGPDYTDLFNLRPEIHTVNVQRGNRYFDESSGSIYTPVLAPACSYDGDSWEPRDDVKGDVARALFYMVTRYDGSDPLTLDLEIGSTPSTAAARFAKLSTLLQWHDQDPVSQAEREQNQLIYSDYQHNRNPFVDHPEYVNEIWGTVTVGNPEFDLTEGSAAENYTLVLSSQPTTNVTLTIVADPSGQVTTVPAAVTFTPANWDQVRTVQAVAVNDDVYEPIRTVTLSHLVTTTDPYYATVDAPSVRITLTDDDPLISAASLPLDSDGPWSPLPSPGFLGENISTYSSDLGTDTDTGSAKFDNSGDRLTIAFGSAPLQLSYHLKGNPGSGTATSGTFKVFESTDGETFILIRTITDKNNSDEILSDSLSVNSRFVSFLYETKNAGNIQLDKLTISAAPTSPWADWMASYGLDETSGAADADPDFDGFENLIEYALGFSPIEPGGDPSTSSFDQTSGTFRITTVLLVSDPSLTCYGETTADLADSQSWTDNGVTRYPAADQAGVAAGFERTVFEVMDTTHSSRFLRLRFESTATPSL